MPLRDDLLEVCQASNLGARDTLQNIVDLMVFVVCTNAPDVDAAERDIFNITETMRSNLRADHRKLYEMAAGITTRGSA